MADVQMTFTEHLMELRTRLIRALVAVIACAGVGYVFRNEILQVLVRPLADLTGETPLQAITLLEPFMAPLHLAGYTGLVLALPYVIYQTVMFCLPALLPHERRVVLGSILAGVVLLYGGLAFGGMLIVPLVVRFMAGFMDPELVRTAFSLQNYVDKVFQIILGFGVAFQLPLVLFAVMRLGIVTPQTLAKQRGFVIVGLVILASLLTPPDVISQVLLAGPLWVLFELSLLLARVLPPPRSPGADE